MQLMRFLRDRTGSVAPILAGAAIPIIGLTGAAVDYSRATSVKASLQAALDSTALSMTKSAMANTSEQFSTDATTYFNAVFNRQDAQNVRVDASYSNTTGPKIVVTASAEVKTMFLNVAGIGIPQIPVSATATTSWSNARLRVALALDNTGSMAQSNKLTALKTATHNLITQLQNASQNNGDVYISIVPFSKDVNAGPANYNASWVDFTEWEKKNGQWTGCSRNCGGSGGGTWVPKDRSTWNGCVMDRDQNNDVTNTAPATGNKSSLFPAEQYGNCPAPILPLTYDWNTLHSHVDSMIATGNTNQTIGLQWAWQSLSETAPLNAPAKDPNYQYKDIIILLTDGLNTENRWSQSQSGVDTRTQKICENIKAAGITLYTVLVMAGNATLLRGCATDPTKYFPLTNADQIISAFDKIGGQLARLHIAK